AASGLHYGPLFQGLRAAWRAGEVVYAEIALPEGTDVDGYTLHPALLDAALHTIALLDTGSDSDSSAQLPFSFTAATGYATGATTLRARVARDPGGVSLQLADGAGAAVASIGALALRPVNPDRLAAEHAQATDPAGDAPPLYRVDWIRVPTATALPVPASQWAV